MSLSNLLRIAIPQDLTPQSSKMFSVTQRASVGLLIQRCKELDLFTGCTQRMRSSKLPIIEKAQLLCSLFCVSIPRNKMNNFLSL